MSKKGGPARGTRAPPQYRTLAPFYDRIQSAKDYAEEAREILRIARSELRRRPRTLLDVACGTGRHLAEFRAHLTVEGIDRSRSMLKVARSRLPSSDRLSRADMRTFRLPRRFDVIVCLFSSVGHLRRRAELAAFWRRVHEQLEPDGVALVEGWLRPERFRSGRIGVRISADPDVKLAVVTTAVRRGSVGVVESHALIGEVGRGVRHYGGADVKPFVTTQEMIAIAGRVGLSARVRLRGRYRETGLFIARRSEARSPGRR